MLRIAGGDDDVSTAAAICILLSDVASAELLYFCIYLLLFIIYSFHRIPVYGYYIVMFLRKTYYVRI